MKILLLLSILLFPMYLFSQTPNPEYDSVLTKSLGADEYGMKEYMFVLLKSGTKTVSDKAIRDSIFSAHLANIKRLADEGKLVIAGPFLNNDKSYRGIFILNVATKEAAEKLLLTDPAVKGQLLEAEIIPWYGSAALPLYLEDSKKIGKFRF